MGTGRDQIRETSYSRRSLRAGLVLPRQTGINDRCLFHESQRPRYDHRYGRYYRCGHLPGIYGPRVDPCIDAARTGLHTPERNASFLPLPLLDPLLPQDGMGDCVRQTFLHRQGYAASQDAPSGRHGGARQPGFRRLSQCAFLFCPAAARCTHS